MFKLPIIIIVLLVISSTISGVKSLPNICKVLASSTKECKYGSYKIPGCQDLKICYKGPGERCDLPWDECAPGTICLPTIDEDEIHKEKCYIKL